LLVIAALITPLFAPAAVARELATPVVTQRYLIVTANPLASAASAAVLKRRGTLDYDAEALATALKALGHSGGATTDVGIIEQSSGLSIIAVKRHRLVGGADMRRDGTVAGR
jgi:gamma-glutamyltranspeptidase